MTSWDLMPIAKSLSSWASWSKFQVNPPWCVFHSVYSCVFVVLRYCWIEINAQPNVLVLWISLIKYWSHTIDNFNFINYFIAGNTKFILNRVGKNQNIDFRIIYWYQRGKLLTNIIAKANRISLAFLITLGFSLNELVD